MIRGGYGIYYDRIILEARCEELVQNDRALTVTAYAGSACTSPLRAGRSQPRRLFRTEASFAAG